VAHTREPLHGSFQITFPGGRVIALERSPKWGVGTERNIYGPRPRSNERWTNSTPYSNRLPLVS
jgi:hypothetical protein